MYTNIQGELEKNLMNLGVMTFLTGNSGFKIKATFFIKILCMLPQTFYKRCAEGVT